MGVCHRGEMYLVGYLDQGSVLGPLLFVLYINDIDRNIVNKLSKFADDTKMYGVVSTQQQIDTFRLDLQHLFTWSQEWQMLFNLDKCKVMHFGTGNTKASYSMGGAVLQVVNCEKDLGVLVQNNLKVSQQCVKAAKTGNRVLGMISRTFQYRSKSVIIKLHKALVRPHLEYCVQAWRPHLQKDINLLENVQKRLLKMLGVNKKYYYEKITEYNITTLETRRLRGDMITVFKIFKGMLDVNPTEYFTVSRGNLRGHSHKLFKNRFVTDVGKFAFSNRVVFEWNLLTHDIVNCNTIDTFKNKLDRHLRCVRGLV